MNTCPSSIYQPRIGAYNSILAADSAPLYFFCSTIRFRAVHWRQSKISCGAAAPVTFVVEQWQKLLKCFQALSYLGFNLLTKPNHFPCQHSPDEAFHGSCKPVKEGLDSPFTIETLTVAPLLEFEQVAHQLPFCLEYHVG